MGPRGRPDARKFFTYQLYGLALRYRAWAQRWPKTGRFATMPKASFERERVGRADRKANRRRVRTGTASARRMAPARRRGERERLAVAGSPPLPTGAP